MAQTSLFGWSTQNCWVNSVHVMDIRHFSYFLDFLFLYLLNRETQHDTHLNPYSENILILLDIIYSQMTPFHKQLFLLDLEPLSFLTMPYSVITRCCRQCWQSPCFVWPFSGQRLRFLISIVVVVVIKRANCVGEEIFIQDQYLIHLSNYCTIWTVSLVFAVIYSWWIA